MEGVEYRSSAGPPAPLDEIKRLTAERDEWKRRAETAENADTEELRVALAGHKKLMEERDALAVQNDVLREALSSLRQYALTISHRKSLESSLALDVLHAAKIAKARRKVVEAAGRWDYHENCDQDCDYEAGLKLHEALVELRKCESENS